MKGKETAVQSREKRRHISRIEYLSIPDTVAITPSERESILKLVAKLIADFHVATLTSKQVVGPEKPSSTEGGQQ